MKLYWTSLTGKRDDNEDSHSIIINYDNHDNTIHPSNLIAIFDGHGGKSVSRFLSKVFPLKIIDKKMKYPLSYEPVKIICDDIQNYLRSKHKIMASRSGSTCVCAVEYRIKGIYMLDIINVGDSRCVLCRNGLAIPLTKDHKPSWPEERQRIEGEGGKIRFDGVDWRIGDLSVSRAFGDIDSPHVLPNPDLYHYVLDKHDQFIVLGCDGLWDVMSCQDVINFIIHLIKTQGQQDNIAEKLAEYAINKGSTDNITIIILFL